MVDVRTPDLVRIALKGADEVKLKTFLRDALRFLIGTTAVAVAFYAGAVCSRIYVRSHVDLKSATEGIRSAVDHVRELR